MLLSALLPSWKLAFDAAGKSPKTITSYLDSAKRLEAYLATEGLPLEPDRHPCLPGRRTRPHVHSAAKHHRNLRVYFHWPLTEGEIKQDPLVRVEKPQVAEEAKPFFTEAELAALLKVTRGQDFEARRDHAIIRVLIDTGIRVSGLANLRFNPTDDKETDVFLDQRRLRVRLKGGDIWWVPIGTKSAAATIVTCGSGHVAGMPSPLGCGSAPEVMPWPTSVTQVSESWSSAVARRLVCRTATLTASATPSPTPGLPQAATLTTS